MKDRRISVNIRKLLDIMHYTEIEDLDAVILSLDFVKCFDKCSFSMLHGSLTFFGFGEVVKQWTQILYKDFSVRIQNNGHLSQEIDIDKGVHQGGCCSSFYFLIIAEILALALRTNKEIDGIMIREIKNILNQFADDMDIATICNEKSLRAIYSELDKFHHQSGFTVSYDKTTLYRIGSLRHSDAQLYDMTEYIWSNRDITVLGVIIAHEGIVEKNYNNMQEKVKNILGKWYNRGLSLIGKVRVVNALVASLFVYKMMVLPKIPKLIVKGLDNIIREFLWNNKKSKIAYSILQNDTKEGGLSLVNLENKDKALKATWPQILSKEEEYAKVVYQSMRMSSINHDIWRCSLTPKAIRQLKIKNTFWEDVLIAWSEYNMWGIRIDNQIIWYNSSILVQNKPIFWAPAHRKGLMFVHQLFENMKYKDSVKIYQEFGITQLAYNSLIAAIPAIWKSFFTSNSKATYFPLAPHNYDTCINLYKYGFSKKVYPKINGDKLMVLNKLSKWEQELRVELDGDQYIAEHRQVYKFTNIPKYRSFQYRLLQRGIVTNVQLFNWKIIDTNMCTFCSIVEESMSHLFFNCSVVCNFWQSVFEYIKSMYNVSLNTSTEARLYNMIVDKRRSHIGNLICLLAKQYIYVQRCFRTSLSFSDFCNRLRHIENMEKYIAIKNNKLDVHIIKWSVPNENVNLEQYSIDYVNKC